MPCTPCGRPVASMRKVTPPAVCQARTWPTVCPFAPMSGIGAPPCGSPVSQPASDSGAAPSAAKATVTRKLGRVSDLLALFNASLPAWFRLDAHKQLPFGDLRPGCGGQFRDRAVEGCGEAMLHLHRLEGDEALALRYFIAGCDFDRRD